MLKPDWLSRFFADDKGNFALLFSICALPVIGGVALAVDYTNMTRYKTILQNATDGATLYASRYYEEHDQLPSQASVLDFVKGNTSFEGITLTKLEYVDGEVIAKTRMDYNPFIIKVVAPGDYIVDATSAAKVAEDIDLEIVMALDNTFSMTAGNKIGGLKTAATNFANTLFDASNAKTRVKIGLVPFAQYVNVGLGNRGASWMDVEADSSSTTTTEVGCRQVRDVIGYDNNACVPATYMNDGVEVTYQNCPPIYGPYYETCEPVTSTSSSTWQGCVGTRGTTSNMLTLKDTQVSEKFPGMMNTWCSTPITPLTNDRTKILGEIAAFSANGNTYIADGVMWGLRVLSPQAPFSEGLDPATAPSKVRKILLLMTDGENQNSPRIDDHPDHWGTDLARADTWTQRACNYAKQQDVDVYTVTFGTQVPISAKNIMKRCASSPANFYDASSSARLDEAFQDIARNLTVLRLTQ